MAFLESPSFDPTISFFAKGGPGFNTTVVVLESGFEQRTINWQNTRNAYDIASAMRLINVVPSGTLYFSAAYYAKALVDFFRCVKGKAYGFRFKDWQDYSALITEGILGTGHGSGVAAYQMYKVYTTGSNTETRIIQKPVAATIKIYKNSVLQTLTTDYSLNSATGVVTFTSDPTSGDTITWSGEFDIPCRFDTDNLQGSADSSGMMIWQSIPVVEIRL